MIVRSCLWLTSIIVAALLVVGGVSFALRGPMGLAAAAAAAGICWSGATAALVLTALLGRSNRAMYGHLLGMFFRLGVPLVAGLILQRQAGALADAGVFGLIVIFYLVALTAETLLSLKYVKHRNGAQS